MEELMEEVRIERYEAYKDSNVEWLGEIPEHWKVVRGKWLFTKHERPIRPNDEIVTCFRDGEVTLRSNRKTEGFTNAIKEHGYQGIRKGDLVIHAMDAFAGAIGVSDSDGKSTPVYAACTPRGTYDVSPFYYAYFLRNLAKNGFIQSLAKGIRERSTDFRFTDFGELLLPVPSLENQTTIVNFLDHKTAQIDKAIAQKEKQIALLQERRHILIHRAVTRGLDANVPMKDSGVEWIGEIPEGWEVKKAKFSFLKFEQGWSPQCDQYKASPNEWGVLKVGCVNHYSFNAEENKLLPNTIKPRLEYQISEGDVLVSRANTTDLVGHAAIIPKIDNKLLLCDKLYRIKIDNKILASDFYINFLKTSYARICVEIGANGASPSMQNIGQGVIKEMYVATPPIEEQTNIVEFIRSMSVKTDVTIQKNKEQLQVLKEYKSTLVSAAVTGKIKVG